MKSFDIGYNIYWQRYFVKLQRSNKKNYYDYRWLPSYVRLTKTNNTLFLLFIILSSFNYGMLNDV